MSPCKTDTLISRLTAERDALKEQLATVLSESMPDEEIVAMRKDRDRLRAACKMVSDHYSGSLDHHPPFVRVCREALHPSRA